MHKVILDTNVFLSGILFGGNPEKLLKLWLEKRFILCFSPILKAEIIQKLELKFEFAKYSIKTISQTIDMFSKKYIPKKKVKICKDPKDNFLLELAQESHADYFVSGDKTVLELKEYKGTKILSPKE